MLQNNTIASALKHLVNKLNFHFKLPNNELIDASKDKITIKDLIEEFRKNKESNRQRINKRNKKVLKK